MEEARRYTYVFPIVRKAETSELLLRFVTSFEKQPGYCVTAIKSNNRTALRHALDELDRKGVDVSKTTVYNPESNRSSVSTHGVIMSLSRTYIQEYGLQESYWNHAVRHVTDCRNVLPHSTTKKVLYNEEKGNVSPGFRHLRSFICRVLYLLTMKALPKFAPRTENRLLLYHEGGGV